MTKTSYSSLWKCGITGGGNTNSPDPAAVQRNAEAAHHLHSCL